MKAFHFSLFCLLIGPSAFAYVPPSEFILRNVVNKRSQSLKSVRVKTHLEAMLGSAGAEKPAGARLSVTTLYNASAGSLRAVVRDDTGKELYVMDRAEGGLPTIDELLFDPKLAPVIETLRAKGIPIRTEDELRSMKDEPERRAAEVEYLTRWKGTYAWVIGRRAALADRPEAQLWIEKDSFGPLRLLMPGSESGTWLDARFESLRYTRGFAFPRTLGLADKDGVVVMRETVSDLAVNPPPGKNEDASLPRGYTEAGNGASAEVRALIQRYFETLR